MKSKMLSALFIMSFIPSISFAKITNLKGIKCDHAWSVVQKEYNVFFSYDQFKSMGLNEIGKKDSLYAILTFIDSDKSCDVVLRFSDLYKDTNANKKFEESLLAKISH